MAAKTTSAAGSFTDDTKWTGAVAPVDAADTLTINHAMTWAPSAGSAFTIGTGSGVALTFGSGGSLTITGLGAFDLTLAGSTAGGNTLAREFVVNATNGAVTVNIDATGAGAGFAMIAGGNYSVTNAGGWNLNGNATYGITVASLPSDASKNSYFTNGGTGGGGNVQASYVTFRRVGVASTTSAFAPTLDNRLRSLTWTNVTLDACGEITLSGDANYTGTISFTRVVSTNTATNGTSKFPLQYTMGAAATSLFTECVFDKKIKFINPRGFNGDACYFHDGWEGTATTTIGGTLANSFVRQTYDLVITAFNINDSFLYWDNPSGANPHWVSVNGSATGTVNYTYNGNVAYYNGNDAAGNVITTASSNTTMSVVANNNLVLPNGAGVSSGTFVTSNGAVGNGFSITANHNTLHVKGTHGFEIGHLYPGADTTNRYASVKSNLFIGGTTGYKCLDVDPVLITDIMTPGNTDYNGSYQIKTTSGTGGFTNEGKGYAAKWSATPGTNDIDGQDPQFVNSAVSLAAWDLSFGGAGTDTAAAARVQATPTLAATLVSYIKAGYAPTNSIYRNAGHDGVTIGAVEYATAGGTNATIVRRGGRFILPL